jgi:hypothetical protein
MAMPASRAESLGLSVHGVELISLCDGCLYTGFDQNGHKSCHVLIHVLGQSARMQSHGCRSVG